MEGFRNFRKMLMSSAYASMSFLAPVFDSHGFSTFEFLIFSRRSSTQMMNKYPAIGSPCLHPLPTWILGVGKPLMSMDDWKFFRREFIQWIYFGERLNNLSVFSINENEMLSNALEKSICSISPGRLLSFACWKMSKVFLVMSPIYLPGK